MVLGDVLTVTAVPRAGADIGLEIFSAGQRSDLLAEALGRQVEVVGAPEAPAVP